MSNAPYLKLRDGTLSVTVWEKNNDGKAYHSAILRKSYKNDDGEWQETDNLNGNELLKAANLLQKAYNDILELRS